MEQGVEQGPVPYSGQDHAAQTVNAANDTGRNHLSNLL